jgi:hypothetical protein
MTVYYKLDDLAAALVNMKALSEVHAWKPSLLVHKRGSGHSQSALASHRNLCSESDVMKTHPCHCLRRDAVSYFCWGA